MNAVFLAPASSSAEAIAAFPSRIAEMAAPLTESFLQTNAADEFSLKAFNYLTTFNYMTQRRIERQFKGIYPGPSKLMSALAYLVWAYALVVLVLTGMVTSETENNTVRVAILMVCVLFAVLFVAEQIRSRLLLLLVYCAVVTHATFFAVTGDADLFELSKEERSSHHRLALTLLITAEVTILLVYLGTYRVYPYLLVHGWINVATWFDVKRGRRANTITYLAGSLHNLRQKRSTIQYTGGVDKDFRPHGYGIWRDTSYHGETLVGVWEHGIPVGPFTSREHGSGYATQQVRVAYGYYRRENAADGADWKPSFPEDKQLRWGIARVECSVAGGFFTFLPRVDHVALVPTPQSARDCAKTLRSPLDKVFYRDTESHAIVGDHATCVTRLTESAEPLAMSASEARAVGCHYEPEALVWIHGINTSLTAATQACGRLLTMGDFPSQIHPFVFSWPGGNPVPFYWKTKQLADSQEIATALHDFLRSIVTAGYTKVHFITHSMGTRVLLNTVEREYLDDLFRPNGTTTASSTAATAVIQSVTFCSPEFPLHRFVTAGGAFDKLRSFQPVITMYGDRWDVALRGSEVANRDARLCGPLVRSLGCSVTSVVREEAYPRSQDTVTYYQSTGSFDLANEANGQASTIAKVNHAAGFHHVAGIATSDAAVSSAPPSYGSIQDFEDQDGDKVDAVAKMYLDMDVIDTSFTDNNVGNNRHSYFSLNESIVEDIREIMVHTRRARRRPGLMRRKGNVFVFLSPPKDIL